MFKLLHTYEPTAILFSIGPIDIYWYGFFMVLAILAGLFITFKLGKKHNIEENTILDLAFYLIIFGLIGARIYDIFLEFPYYIKYPLDSFKIWQGGLAIHGAIIGGMLGLYQFCKKSRLPFFTLAAIITPGFALGQAIGRFGNYFNQELFGKPTEALWGIPINIINRPDNFLSNTHFHPTFLYESIGNLVIFGILLYLNVIIIRNINKDVITRINFKSIVLLYLVLYSCLRFSLEFVRIDYSPMLFGMKWPQIISLLIIIGCFTYFFKVKNKHLE